MFFSIISVIIVQRIPMLVSVSDWIGNISFIYSQLTLYSVMIWPFSEIVIRQRSLDGNTVVLLHSDIKWTDCRKSQNITKCTNILQRSFQVIYITFIHRPITAVLIESLKATGIAARTPTEFSCSETRKPSTSLTTTLTQCLKTIYESEL